MTDVTLLKIYNWWFDSNNGIKLWIIKNKSKRNEIDNYITNTYIAVLKKYQSTDLTDILKYNQDYNIDSYLKRLVTIIIILDQFSRNIVRTGTQVDVIQNTLKSEKISVFLCQTKYIHRLPLNNLIFVLMPLKHTNIINNFQIIKKIISKSINITKNRFANISENDLYRFYQDSLKKYIMSLPGPNNVLSSDRFGYKDDIFNNDDFSKICEYYPARSVVLLVDHSVFKSNVLFKKCIELLDLINERNKLCNNLTVSLSGGPDSMVLTYILSKIRFMYNIKINAFHLNYNNRVESLLEEKMLINFCSEIKIPLFIHRITHLKRNSSRRKFYEDVTRDIRFKMYKNLGGHIVLGHIKEDLIENIWSNFCGGRDLFKLHKIEPISNIENVNIYRPLCRVEKQLIYDFAHSHYIPYLKNTTPTWSNRAKLRNEFLPMVEKHFGKDTEKKILYLSDSLSSYKELLDKKIFKPIFDSVEMNEESNCLKLYIGEYYNMGLHFWQHVLTEIFHKLGNSMPSLKSIQNFVNLLSNLKHNKLKNTESGILNIMLKKEFKAIINRENYLFITPLNI